MTTRTFRVLIACLALAGCGSSPKPRYYTLQMPPASAGQPSDKAQAGVVVGPVNLPEAVDRVQLVLRSGDNTVDISDAHRWAEPLKSQVARVLAANLAR
ncbi:PqiC family protein, partial [Methylogaea oryzae]